MNRRLLLLSLLWCLPAIADDISVAHQPVFDVRLRTSLSSISSIPGTKLSAIVVSPVVIDGMVVVPVGATVYGDVAVQRSVGLGFQRERAVLEVRFHEFSLPDGSRYPLSASLAMVDNSREEVTKSGQIRGILAADSVPGYIFGLWHRPSTRLLKRAAFGLTGPCGMTWLRFVSSPVAEVGVLGFRYAFVPWPNPEIALPSGTEMRLRLEAISEDAPASAPTTAENADADLSRDLNARPFQLAGTKSQPVGDIINIAMIGSKDQLNAAFSDAGWFSADSLNKKTSSLSFRAWTHGQGYATAPVSLLTYQAQSPEMVFQKSFNTVSKRHHIRVWNTGSVWLGAATHDVGVKFETRNMAFSHQIDLRVDMERTKVINDLSIRGCLDRVEYVDRPAAVSMTPAPKTIQTDGRIAVLYLRDCSAAAPLPDDAAVSHEPSLPYRLTQRLVLETRNYLFRRNVYFESVKMVGRAFPGSKRLDQPAREWELTSYQANLP